MIGHLFLILDAYTLCLVNLFTPYLSNLPNLLPIVLERAAEAIQRSSDAQQFSTKGGGRASF